MRDEKFQVKTIAGKNNTLQEAPLLALGLRRTQYAGLLGFCIFALAPLSFFASKLFTVGYFSIIILPFFLALFFRAINRSKVIFFHDRILVRRLCGAELVLRYEDIRVRCSRTMVSLFHEGYYTMLRIGDKNKSNLSQYFTDIILNLKPLFMNQEDVDKLFEILREKAGVDLPDYYRTVGRK